MFLKLTATVKCAIIFVIKIDAYHPVFVGRDMQGLVKQNVANFLTGLRATGPQVIQYTDHRENVLFIGVFGDRSASCQVQSISSVSDADRTASHSQAYSEHLKQT